MKLRYARILSLLLCAALACSILAGCGGSTASSSEAPSSASSSASSAASGEDLPDSTTRADTSGLNPGDFDENSIFSITGTAAAFEPCLGWGPGVSGCSLKSVIAAASLLQWDVAVVAQCRNSCHDVIAAVVGQLLAVGVQPLLKAGDELLGCAGIIVLIKRRCWG